jgi:hypothetical protein
MISHPVVRAIDKALRMMTLTYEIQAARWGLPAASLHRLIPWYQVLTNNPRALERMFEHDKADLRQLDVPIATQLVGDPPEPRYRVDVNRLQLPARGPRDAQWAVLEGHAPLLQAIADRLPDMPGQDAAALSFSLLAFRQDLGLQIPAWSMPQNLLTNARVVLEWAHAILHTVEATGRTESTFGGAPVPVREVAALTGFSSDFLWHLADRGANTPDSDTAETQVVRVVATTPEEGIAVVSRELRRGWRPRRVHIDALLQWAAANHPLPPDLIAALRSMQRGGSGASGVALPPGPGTGVPDAT